MRIVCRNCGRGTEVLERVGFRDTCPSCDAWLHSCVHCRFWSDNRCTETAAEKIGDPEAANFCEWYQAKEGGSEGPEEKKTGRDDAEELWKKLIKN
jgi:hypothetical protein